MFATGPVIGLATPQIPDSPTQSHYFALQLGTEKPGELPNSQKSSARRALYVI